MGSVVGIDVERLAHGLEFGGLLSLEFAPDLLKQTNHLGCVQAFPAVKADLGGDEQHGGIVPPTKDLFDLLLTDLAATHGTFLERRHSW